jgi:hypothetical protein
MRATLAREVNRKMMGKLLFGNLWAGCLCGLEFKVQGLRFKAEDVEPGTLNLEPFSGIGRTKRDKRGG